jgi:hypothetical protein
VVVLRVPERSVPNAVTFVRILIGLATLRITLLEEIR